MLESLLKCLASLVKPKMLVGIHLSNLVRRLAIAFDAGFRGRL